MHAHMRGTELKEEEEEFWECEEALKKSEEIVICEREFEKWNKKSRTSFNRTQ
jgi:hypothetical protein